MTTTARYRRQAMTIQHHPATTKGRFKNSEFWSVRGEDGQFICSCCTREKAEQIIARNETRELTVSFSGAGINLPVKRELPKDMQLELRDNGVYVDGVKWASLGDKHEPEHSSCIYHELFTPDGAPVLIPYEPVPAILTAITVGPEPASARKIERQLLERVEDLIAAGLLTAPAKP